MKTKKEMQKQIQETKVPATESKTKEINIVCIIFHHNVMLNVSVL